MCCLCATASANPKSKPKSARTAASRFVERDPRPGDYGLLRALTKFQLTRPKTKAFEFTPRPVRDLMMPKAANPKAARVRPQGGGESPKIEFYAGYQYTRFDAAADGTNLHGFQTSVAVYPFKHFGFVADIGAGYISDTIFVDNILVRGKGNLITYLFGPRVKGGNDRVTAFVHGLVGGARVKATGTATAGGTSVKISETENAFGVAAGGGVDIKLSDRISFRIFQAEYLLTRFFDENQHSARVSTGLVFH